MIPNMNCKNLYILGVLVCTFGCSSQMKLAGSDAESKTVVASNDSKASKPAENSGGGETKPSGGTKVSSNSSQQTASAEEYKQVVKPTKEIAGSFLTECGFTSRVDQLECFLYSVSEDKKTLVTDKYELKLASKNSDVKLELQSAVGAGILPAIFDVSKPLAQCSDSLVNMDPTLIQITAKISGVDQQVAHFELTQPLVLQHLDVSFAIGGGYSDIGTKGKIYCLRSIKKVLMTTSSSNSSSFPQLLTIFFESESEMGTVSSVPYSMSAAISGNSGSQNKTMTSNRMQTISSSSSISKIKITGIQNPSHYGIITFEGIFEH